jgi:hypothetical protein
MAMTWDWVRNSLATVVGASKPVERRRATWPLDGVDSGAEFSLPAVFLAGTVAAIRALPLSTCTRLLICMIARSLFEPNWGTPLANAFGVRFAVDVEAMAEVITTELPDALT